MVLGVTATLFVFSKGFDYFFGDCFYEQGCDPYEDIKVISMLLVSILIGISVSYTSLSISKKFLKS